jgi:hypothetical protein
LTTIIFTVDNIVNKTITITLPKIVQILFANNEIKVANIPKIAKAIKLENNMETTNPPTSASVTSFNRKVNGAINIDIKAKKKLKQKKTTNLINVALLLLMGLDNNINSVPSS